MLTSQPWLLVKFRIKLKFRLASKALQGSATSTLSSLSPNLISLCSIPSQSFQLSSRSSVESSSNFGPGMDNLLFEAFPPETASPPLYSPEVACFTPLHLVMCSLDAAVQPWKPIPRSSRCTVLESNLKGIFYLKGSLAVVVFDVFIGSSEQQHSGAAVLKTSTRNFMKSKSTCQQQWDSFILCVTWL